MFAQQPAHARLHRPPGRPSEKSCFEALAALICQWRGASLRQEVQEQDASFVQGYASANESPFRVH
eukprot:1533620-Amphidinium_carterae.1